MFWILFAVIAAIGGAGQYALGMAQMYPPWAALLARKSYKEHPDLIPTTSDLVTQRWKGIISDNVFYEEMAQAGYNRERSDAIYKAAETYLNAYDYVSLWRRHIIDDNTLTSRLSSIGVPEDRIQDVKNATLYFPTATDIVTFAVREVFKPDIVEKYGQDKEIDADYLEQAKRAGLSEQFARWFWSAHWQLPSANQGYQMLHYGAITNDELKKLLATLDYMPYWRDKLETISYNPINRVDIRRIYQAGFVDRERVKNEYKKQGYTNDDAELITRWVEATYGPKPAGDITGTNYVVGKDQQVYPNAALLVDSFKRGLITEGELRNGLVQLDYAPTTIALLVERVKQDIEQEKIDLEANAITDQYRSGAIDIEQYKLELTKLGVPSQLMETTIARELAQAKSRVKMPSRADYEKWAKIGIIDKGEFEGGLRILGYRDSDIELYWQEIEISLQPKSSSG